MWLTVEDVAARLRVGPETVRVWLRRRELPGMRLPGNAGWRVRRSELELWEAGRTLDRLHRDSRPN